MSFERELVNHALVGFPLVRLDGGMGDRRGLIYYTNKINTSYKLEINTTQNINLF